MRLPLNIGPLHFLSVLPPPHGRHWNSRRNYQKKGPEFHGKNIRIPWIFFSNMDAFHRGVQIKNGMAHYSINLLPVKSMYMYIARLVLHVWSMVLENNVWCMILKFCAWRLISKCYVYLAGVWRTSDEMFWNQASGATFQNLLRDTIFFVYAWAMYHEWHGVPHKYLPSTRLICNDIKMGRTDKYSQEKDHSEP